MAGSMQITLEPREDGVAVARFAGRLDFSASTEVRACFADAVAGGKNKLVVDLGDVQFIDSAGLGALISGMRVSRQAGGDLRLARPNDQARTLLSLTSLDQVLITHASIEEAIDGFSGA